MLRFSLSVLKAVEYQTVNAVDRSDVKDSKNWGPKIVRKRPRSSSAKASLYAAENTSIRVLDRGCPIREL